MWSSPAVAGGVVYVGSHTGRVYAFAPTTYDVTFTESGLASGTSWSVTFNGVNKSSTSDSISFTAPNGVYAYSVDVPSGYSSSSTLSGNLTVADANVTKTITFTQDTYTLTMLVVGEGTVSPGNGTHLSGSNVSLGAVASGGWSFSGWSGDASGSANTTIIMDGAKTVTATFVQEYATVGGELSQTGYIESFFVPELVMIGLSGAICMLGFVHIKRSKQTRENVHKV